MLARELASIDLLSGGRLEVGLGRGWKRLDYERSGIPMDPPKVRVDRMIEHTQVLKALFGGEPVTFAGEHYQITDLDGTPKPHRPGGPPILIGGGGRRVLRFAAGVADIVGVNASIHSGEVDTAAAQDALPASIDEKVAWVREAAGDRLDDIEINAWLSVAEVTDDSGGARRGAEWRVRDRTRERAWLAAHPHRVGVRDRRPAPGTPRALGLLVHGDPRRPGP